MSRTRSLRSAAATLSLVSVLAAGGTAPANGSGPHAAPADDRNPDPVATARSIDSHRELGVRDVHALRLGDALRHFDAAVGLAEEGDLPAAAANARLYRGFVLALLQRPEAATDLDLFAQGVADLAPELAPLAFALRRQILGLASGDLDLVVESLEEIGRAYRDRLPPIYFQGLELITLLRAERFEEAGTLCRDMLTSRGLAAVGPTESSARALSLSCSIADFLARATGAGVGRQDLLDLAGELMTAIPDQPEPLQEPIRRLLEQVWAGGSEAGTDGRWASEADLAGPLKLFYRVAGESVPPDLRAGLDDALAALTGDLVSIKARAGEAAASFALAELARARTYLDRLAPELPEEPDPYPSPTRPTPAGPTPERRR